MTTIELLATLQAQGVKLEAHGDKLRYCPSGVIAGETLRELAAHKEEILAILKRGKVEVITCPGDDCDQRVLLVNGVGRCHQHNMSISVHAKIVN